MTSIVRRLVAGAALGALVLLVAVLVGLGTGPGDVSLWSLGDGDASTRAILEVRFARVVLSALVGAGLSACGATLQTLLRNPLADPYVLGTSGGAALFATTALALGLVPATSSASVPAVAFVGALLATLFVWSLSRGRSEHAATSVVLAGIVVNAFASAIVTFLKVLVSPAEGQKILFWLVGSIGYESPSTLLGLGVATALGVFALVLLARPLQLLGLGDDVALSLGVHVARVRLLAFVVTSALVGSLVAFAGLVGFVGLVVPHAVRRLVGADERLVVPTSALCGAAFLVLADALSRALFRWLGTEPPVGAITAMVGCPVFLWILRRR